jgi:hypothetical protein
MILSDAAKLARAKVRRIREAIYESPSYENA